MGHAPSYNTELPPQCGKQGHHHKSSYIQGVETLSQLSNILTYFQFTRHSLDLSDNVPYDWLFPHHYIRCTCI